MVEKSNNDNSCNLDMSSNDNTEPVVTKDSITEKKVPVSEAIKYRKRAQVAEKMLTEMQDKVGSLSDELKETEETVKYLERKQHINSLLAQEEAIDLDAARLLTEIAIESMDEPDIEETIKDLRESKPYLFRSKHSICASAMPANEYIQNNEIETAAVSATQTGNRADLLRYLRIKRKKK
ncbi:hypothetical protein JD969_09050 [Planctomycetota bacterium]|nr:hypothetical protein JD969_09050 [Planctomycetota bacterium]